MNDSNLRTFAERLASVVDAKGPSRAAFARAIGIGDTTLKSYMQGGTEPGVTELVNICGYANVNLHWLVHGEGPRNADDLSESSSNDRADTRYVYSRDLVIAVVKAMEEELLALNLNPPPAKRADLVAAFCYLFKPYGKIERDAVRMLIETSV